MPSIASPPGGPSCRADPSRSRGRRGPSDGAGRVADHAAAGAAAVAVDDQRQPAEHTARARQRDGAVQQPEVVGRHRRVPEVTERPRRVSVPAVTPLPA